MFSHPDVNWIRWKKRLFKEVQIFKVKLCFHELLLAEVQGLPDGALLLTFGIAEFKKLEKLPHHKFQIISITLQKNLK